MADIWIYISAILAIPMLYIISVLFAVFKYLLQIRKICKALAPFATEEPHWFWGHLRLFPGPGFPEGALLTLLAMSNKSDKGATSWILPLMPALVVGHPDTVKLITNSNAPKGTLPATGSVYKFFKPWLGDGLLTSNGNKWFRNRKLLTPAFHFDILKPYMDVYNECVSNMMNKIKQQSENGKSIEVFEVVSLCTLNILLKCAFSSNENIQEKGSSSPYVKTVHGLTKLFLSRFFEPLSYSDTIYALTSNGKKFLNLCDSSHKTALNVIKQRRKTLENKDKSTIYKSGRYVDFLDILLLARDENGESLTDLEIQDEVETFMFAGHDTTASGISWILYNLARQPEFQEQARGEVDNILKDKSEIEWDDLGKFSYLTMCIKESLRLHPPVPSVSRELTSPLFIGEHEIPPGTVVYINIFNLHHNTHVWGENHMEYIPERFLPDNISKMDSHAFMPFSAGKRNCIGQVFAMNELKTTIALILHRFNISLDETHVVKMEAAAVLRANNGIKLHFQERN